MREEVSKMEYLSLGGRLTLINFVLDALPTNALLKSNDC